MSRPIRFLLGSLPVEIADEDPQLTVLDWLRTRAGRTGTKEGCAEGDCGACTVAVGALVGDHVRYRAYNACIQLLATLDGKQLVTVEDLASGKPGEEVLHPVQQAMVDRHASQCGFCTPGFVMSLFTLFHETRESASRVQGDRAKADRGHVDRAHVDRILAGNLCRCTGYAPIVRAAQDALGGPRSDAFTQAKPEIVAQLRAWQHGEPLELEVRGRRWYAPRRLERLWELLERHPDALLVAGATDVGLWLAKDLREFETLIYLGEVGELLGIEHGADGRLRIGGAVTYTDALDPLCAAHPALQPLLLRLGAEQVRNAGTIGGNIANGSPIGDMPPPLIALGTTLVVSSRQGSRELPLEEFFIDYGKQDLRAGEIVEAVSIPAADPGLRFAAYKVSKRFDQDISGLCGAFSLRLDGDVVADARICFGGMAGTPRRATGAEAALQGRPWTESTIAAAAEALARDYTPLTDWRATARYRTLAAQNLLQRFFLETTSSVPVRLAAGAGS